MSAELTIAEHGAPDQETALQQPSETAREARPPIVQQRHGLQQSSERNADDIIPQNFTTATRTAAAVLELQ